MKTHSVLNKTFVVLLCTVLAFVCVARPLQARADSASMDYVETDMSTNDVKALFTGASAIVPAAIMIIGFIVMCYCVLRNVEVPLQFDSQTSFNDKLTQLGQYAIDNATDDIKDFLYSVYTYCNDNGITSVLGLSKFVALQAAKFFGAITNWIGGSLISNRSNVGEGLLNQFVSSFLTDLLQPYTGSISRFVDSSSYEPLFGLVQYNSWSYHYNMIGFARNPVFDYQDYIAVCFNNGFAVYSINGDSLSFNNSTDAFYSSYSFDLSNGSSVSWSLNISSSNAFFDVGNEYILISNSSGITYSVQPIYNFITSLGFKGIYQYPYTIGNASSIPSQLQLDILNPATDVAGVLNPAVDNVYVPTDAWNIDIVGTWDQIARDVSATYDQTERIAAFVGDIPLTLTSAQSYAPTINDAGNYVFPDFGSVWKYPQYFFDTLSGWGMFVGNCLRAVTVDEGGLSWIFYGGFVLLVCGGIIGKILMG